MAAEGESGVQQYVRISDIANEPQQLLTPISGYDELPLVSLEEAVEPLVSILPTIHNHVSDAKRRCQSQLQPGNVLTLDQSASVMLYTMSWIPRDQCLYVALNRTLRTEERENLKPWFLYLKLILTAISRLPLSTEKLIYRGIKQDLSELYQQDVKFVWWGFSSCTSSLQVLQNHFLGSTGPRTLFHIECNGGKDISSYSRYNSEKEIIILPGRQFQVKSCLQQPDLHIIHLKEIESPICLLQPTITKSVAVNKIPDNISKILRYLPYGFLFALMAILLAVSYHPSNDVENSSRPIESTKINSYQNIELQEKIRKYQHCSSINFQTLNLYLTDQDMEIVVREAILNKQCREIWLSDSNITSVGISILASAFSYPNSLEILVVSNSGASDDGVKALVKQLSNNANKLIRLGLVNNNITTKGAKYIAQLLETNTILTQLDLEYNQIGDEGVRILTDVIAYRKTRISRLNLSWNALTDKSVDYIAQMIKKSPLLKRILLYDNHVSAIDKIKIAKAKLYANVLKIGQKWGIKRDISKRFNS